MQKTFYIDIDEEISSVIDKLHKSSSVDNYFVVPRRTMVMQSIVNLKLLKREADKLKKNVVIVAQDEQITTMSERAGIATRLSVEGIDLVEEKEEIAPKKESMEGIIVKKKERLVGVGTSDFYGKEEDDVESGTKIKKSLQSGGVSVNGIASDVSVKKQNNSFQESRGMYVDNMDPEKEKKIERILHFEKKEKEKIVQAPVAKKSKNLIFVSILVSLFILLGVVAYLFVPSASVVVYLKNENKNISTNAKSSLDEAKGNIQNNEVAGRIIEKEQEITLSNQATGFSESSGQKAKGKLVIYNEYNNSAQALIATTRFETEDGKIFRLVKGVSVPGMSSVGGEMKPGAIEVDVIADEPGGDYNIGPAKFSIPGLKGGPKYGKIYAKSTENISGGSLSGDGIKMVNQSDIDNAKNETEKVAKEKIINLIKEELAEGETLLDDGIKFETVESIAYATSGDVKEKFDYYVKAKMKMVVFQEKDVKNIIERIYKEKKTEATEYVIKNIELKYDNFKIDFDNKSLEFRANAVVGAAPSFDASEFKKSILGKNEDQIKIVLEKYSYVRNFEVDIWPIISSRIPSYASRVSLDVKDYESK
ncbi:MAG: hypothetical protein ACD_11C00108G0023 [uncultured bacterium]|nr:MAG: hypothetical protein ACD_11C00108G0023 [uncultured bacterium]HBR71429.1 hypothetical protein [Candidatus Moranbacteria bacterium]